MQMLSWSKNTDSGLLRASIIRGSNFEIKLIPFNLDQNDDLVEDKPLCYLSAKILNNGNLNFSQISIGHPPITVEINDAIDVFTFMTKSMGKAKYTSMGPLPERNVSKNLKI